MNNEVLISVIMSVYNGEKYLSEAIDSVLIQTFKNFEFIIVNDGSTDDSLDLIKTYSDSRIKIIDQKNTGLSKALNNGIKIAQGKYIARLDADDIALSTRFEKQIEYLENNHGCVALGSNAIYISEKGEELYVSNYSTKWEDIKSKLPIKNPFFHSAVMFRRDACVKSGLYYEKIVHHIEDIILWNKLTDYGELRNLEEPLIKYRFVPDALTNRSKKTTMFLNGILLKILNDGGIDEDYLRKVKFRTRKRSERWRFSCYYNRLGTIFMLKDQLKRKKAIENLIRAIIFMPSNSKAWFYLFLSLQPKFLITSWKKIRQIH
jgi:glycosyltransferase involved in cell wall biosynthesis